MAAVKAIPPQRKEPPLKKVAAYCRVSTKSQEQLDSLAAQERYYEEQIKANPNWKFAGIYADIGSGATIKGRKRFNVLLSACRRGKVDMVLITSTAEFKTQLLEAAVAAGTVEKSADGMYKVLTKNGQGGVMKETIDATHMFNDSLAYQWMTTEVLTETLKDYADETTEIGKKAFAAAQDVKIFSQLMDTLKESAQSGWAETWQLIVGDYEEAKVTLREFSEFFSNIIDGSSKARNALLGGALTSSWGQLKNEVSDAGFSVDAFRDALRETASESVAGLDKMIEEAGSFDATLSQGWLTTDILAKTLDKLANEATGTTGGISALSDEQLKNIGYTEEQIAALRSLSSQANSSTGEIADLVQNMTRKSGREAVNVQSFLKIVRKYTAPTELTPALLREFVEKIVVHAPDKSSGHRTQRIDVHYNFIGEIDFSPEYSQVSRQTTA